jgi:hypothetical protein
MKPREVSPAQLRRAGLEALAEVLGPVGMARFLQQFDIGSGDYTRDRERWLRDVTLRDAATEIKRRRGELG